MPHRRWKPEAFMDPMLCMHGRDHGLNDRTACCTGAAQSSQMQPTNLLMGMPLVVDNMNSQVINLAPTPAARA